MTKQKAVASEAGKKLSVQETMKRMQEHYAQTGAYRSDHLARVLGDPVKGLGLGSKTTQAPPKGK